MIYYNGAKSLIMDPPPGRIWNGKDFPKIGGYIWKPEWIQWEIPGVARMTDAGVARESAAHGAVCRGVRGTPAGESGPVVTPGSSMGEQRDGISARVSCLQ